MPPFLAQAGDFTPVSGPAQLTIVSLLVVASLMVSIWAVLRRQPPVDSELVKLRAELASLELRFGKFEKRHIDELKNVWSTLDQMRRDNECNFKTIERALGRIEGHATERKSSG
jgi:hypothetical protein